MYVLQYAKQACDILQGTKYLTVNLVLPVLGRLGHMMHCDTSLEYDGKRVSILNEDVVVHARELLYKEIFRRFYNGLADCKLEDFIVSTLLDPRYKAFNFKHAKRWLKGKFTREKAFDWITKAWDIDWKPKPVAAEEPPPAQSESEEMDELRKYFAFPDAKPDVDPVVWWKAHLSELPNLARMARQLLVVPASTAGVERAFSVVSSIHGDLRKSLQEGTIQHTLMAAM
eukprot:gene34287-biopygen23875